MDHLLQERDDAIDEYLEYQKSPYTASWEYQMVIDKITKIDIKISELRAPLLLRNVTPVISGLRTST